MKSGAFLFAANDVGCRVSCRAILPCKGYTVAGLGLLADQHAEIPYLSYRLGKVLDMAEISMTRKLSQQIRQTAILLFIICQLSPSTMIASVDRVTPWHALHSERKLVPLFHESSRYPLHKLAELHTLSFMVQKCFYFQQRMFPCLPSAQQVDEPVFIRAPTLCVVFSPTFGTHALCNCQGQQYLPRFSDAQA